MTLALPFTKYEGLGNDFVVVDVSLADAQAFDVGVAARLCDRRRGVGADGVLVVSPPSAAGHLARMRVINADGSVPEMCGNGLRCVALHLARQRGASALEGSVETDAGTRPVVVRGDATAAEVTVDMGEVGLGDERSVEIAGETVRLVDVNVGNPHAVLVPLAAVHERARIERLGPILERHPSFPAGVNVELVSREGTALRVTVWERGVGFTEACGTGACAVVAALTARGDVEGGVETTVRLPGGELHITMQRGRARMRGPARYVFSGVFS